MNPVECWLTDTDGVLVHEEPLEPGADAFLAELVERDIKFLVLTNNSIYTRATCGPGWPARGWTCRSGPSGPPP